MADDAPGDFTVFLQLLTERVTTLSVQVESMRALLESRGVFTAADFDQRATEVRAQAQLAQHPHEPLTRTLTLDEYSARIRKLLTPDPPPV